MLQVKCRHWKVFFVFLSIRFPSLEKKKLRFLSLIDEPELDEERSLSVHLQPPGKMPHALLKVIQTVHSQLPKAWNVWLQLSCLPHSPSVKLLSVVSLELFLQSISGTCPAVQLHGRGAEIPLSYLQFQALIPSLRSHLTPAFLFPLPPMGRIYHE